MLTGLVVPTSGEAYVSGRNLKTEMAAIRRFFPGFLCCFFNRFLYTYINFLPCSRMIGVCPQQNVLFGRLTVLEHLELYGALKGIPPLGRREAAEVMVAQLGFFDKLHTPASDLSGGMKRKLQVEIPLTCTSHFLSGLVSLFIRSTLFTVCSNTRETPILTGGNSNDWGLSSCVSG